MPKIIENLKDKFLCEARAQIEQNGYGKTTVRSIAAACGVGVGTVYNYFSSKEMLIATFMAEDWKKCLEQMKNDIGSAEDARAALACVYRTITGYITANKRLFSDRDAAKVFALSVGERHKMLRAQVAACIACFYGSDFSAEFVAEALLTWTVEGKDFGQIYSCIKDVK